MENIKEKVYKLNEKACAISAITTISAFNLFNKAFAAGESSINTQQVSDVTGKIKDAVTSLAMPIGSLLIFISVVLTAIRIAIHHNNPKSRSEDLSSIGWLVIAGLLLGASLVIAGIIIKVTSNNGSLY